MKMAKFNKENVRIHLPGEKDMIPIRRIHLPEEKDTIPTLNLHQDENVKIRLKIILHQEGEKNDILIENDK